MNIRDSITSLKPYALGTAVGAVGIAIIGFSADWIVTTGTMNEKVQAAKVSALAQVCETNALAHWKEQGKKASALEGWDNDAREKLAKQFAPTTAKKADYQDEIVDQCDDLLRPA
ncbi:hypothetical protein [Ferruginivarius sediminum]|uniref:hypothetical protein n=1 Tax=Ferruginivarius sediminum TaxID=2661937 RepID=UPI00137ACB5B|nr:hypothetical protein [Ferruginivarius sediminum]